jgi:hypothetical protein
MPRKAKSTKKKATTTKKKTTAKRGAKAPAKKKGGMKLKKATVRNLTPGGARKTRAPMAYSAADSAGGCGGGS